MFVVFDLDGTLALTDHRVHHLTGPKKDWRAFYAACVDDKPCEPVLAVLQAMVKAGHRVEIWTGRSAEVRWQTFDWLVEHGAKVFFRMREIGDHRPDTELKAEWMAQGDKPDLIFEDRKSMVDMWRSHGIVCCQVAPGDF